jgi:XkdW protein
MNLYEKILTLYPELSNFDFSKGIISLQNDSDGRGDYIAIWDHPTLPRPTDEQLAALEAK